MAALALGRPAPAATVDRKLWWRGTAHVEVEGRSLDLAAETSLDVPLLRVRSTTYIIAQGPATARTLILEPDSVWVERAGQRSAMPPQFGIHERQQFAMYAWLYLVQRVKQMRQQARLARSRKLSLASPPYPDVVFDIGADGYPVAAEWTVEDAEPGKPPIPQRIAFTGRIGSHGVRWPRRFDLTRDGKPYFLLDIAEFRAS